MAYLVGNHTRRIAHDPIVTSQRRAQRRFLWGSPTGRPSDSRRPFTWSKHRRPGDGAAAEKWRARRRQHLG
jgi:hypothetical protein